MIDERCQQCHGCPSNRGAPIHRRDTIARDIAIVVDHPTAMEQSKENLLLGDTGYIVKQMLQEVGINADECYVTTALNCRPNVKKEKMMKNAMLSCRGRVVRELKEAGVTKVLSIGSVCLSQMLGAERVLPPTSVRGRWEHAHGMDIMSTLNPTWFFGEPDFFRDFCDDLLKFGTIPPEPAPDLEMWYPQTIKEMWEAFDFLSEASFVSCDVETTGLSPHKDELLAVGFGVLYQGTLDGTSVVLRQDLIEAEDTWESIGKLFAAEQSTVLHNMPFDVKWVKKHLRMYGIPYRPKRLEDTMFLHYCLDERPMGRFQSHNLKNISRYMCDAPDYDIQMRKWLKEYNNPKTTYERKAEMRSRMHEYLALDCYYTARIYPPLLEKVVSDPDLFRFYENHLIPAAHTLLEVEETGALIDREFFEKSWIELNQRAQPILEKVRELTGKPEFNPNSPPQVAEYLYKEQNLPVLRTARRGKLQEGKTSKQVLKMLKKQHPQYTEVIDGILQYRNLIKNAGTYVKGILERVDEDDRIRSSFLPHGTATGRISSSSPNLQNIPEASHTKIEIRYGYMAPEGYWLGEADYSQLELRVAAWFCEDEGFRKVYIEDRDLHQEVAFTFFNKPKEEVTKYERYMAKCMNFGVVYGRGASSLAYGPEMDYVEDELGGQRWALEEVKEFFDKFFGAFPKLKMWMDKQAKIAYTEHEVTTPFGNKRRFPFIPRNDDGAVGRQGFNSPIQGTAALLTINSLIRIHRRFKELNAEEDKEVAHIVLTVHDSIMFEFLPEYLNTVKEIVRYEMEDNLPFEIPLPVKSDFDYAPRWGLIGKWKDKEQILIPVDAEAE